MTLSSLRLAQGAAVARVGWSFRAATSQLGMQGSSAAGQSGTSQ